MNSSEIEIFIKCLNMFETKFMIFQIDYNLKNCGYEISFIFGLLKVSLNPARLMFLDGKLTGSMPLNIYSEKTNMEVRFAVNKSYTLAKELLKSATFQNLQCDKAVPKIIANKTNIGDERGILATTFDTERGLYTVDMRFNRSKYFRGFILENIKSYFGKEFDYVEVEGSSFALMKHAFAENEDEYIERFNFYTKKFSIMVEDFAKS